VKQARMDEPAGRRSDTPFAAGSARHLQRLNYRDGLLSCLLQRRCRRPAWTDCTQSTIPAPSGSLRPCLAWRGTAAQQARVVAHRHVRRHSQAQRGASAWGPVTRRMDRQSWTSSGSRMTRQQEENWRLAAPRAFKDAMIQNARRYCLILISYKWYGALLCTILTSGKGAWNWLIRYFSHIISVVKLEH